MKSPVIVVPFKALGRKSRLAGVLGGDDAERFAVLMLRDLLAVLKKAGKVKDAIVVSSDPHALRIARRGGAGTLLETRDNGVNAAVEAALAAKPEAKSFLVLPTDIPLLTSEDLGRILSLAAEGFSVISPSAAFDGTNALLFTRTKMPALRYDDRSFWSHLAGLARVGARVAVLTQPGVTSDIDTEADFHGLSRVRINRASAEFAKKAARQWVSSSKTAG